MNCSLGDAYADTGFSFLEKLHSPIFLLHKNGQVKRMNEAGRKLLAVGRVNRDRLATWGESWAGLRAKNPGCDFQRIRSRFKEMKLISRPLAESDYFIVELIR